MPSPPLLVWTLSSPGFAQEASNDDQPEGEIIVTGERTPRSIVETSSSVAVTTQEDLDRFAGADTLTRILEQTANVSPTGDDNEGPSIRGVDSSGILTSLEAFFGGSQPRTTVEVDGLQLSFNEFVFAGASSWDIERVEVFRGPQTTTQGRNAVAGAIFVETADPNHREFEGRVRGIFGGRDERQLSGVLSGPIGSGELAYRLAGDYREEESFVIPVGVIDYGEDLRQVESLILRGKLGYQPASLPGFDALLTLSHTDTQRPQTESVDAPFFDRERKNPGYSVFAPEFVWNYEAFAKARVAGGRLLLTGNVFYSDFENYQVASLTELGPGFFANTFSNVAEARAFGAEIGARYEAADSLFLDFGLGLLDTGFGSDSSSCDFLDGNEFERAPTVTATGGIAWQPLPGLELSGFARYSDGYASDAANVAANTVEDYIVADVQASYTIGPVRLFAYATNVFGNDYELSIFSDGSLANIGDPRRVSEGIKFAF